jgi:Chromate transport protein ChrA
MAIFLQFLWLGCTSFGGPVAHLGIFRRVFVEQKQVFSESDYANLVALCQVIPGPASSLLAWGLAIAWVVQPGHSPPLSALRSQAHC